MQEIRFEKLQNIVNRVKVGFVGSVNKFYCESSEAGSVPIIRTTDIDDLNRNDLKYVTREFHEQNKKSQIFKGDLIIARHGENGNAMVYNFEEEAQVLNAVIIRPDERKVRSEVLKLFFDSPFIKNQIKGCVKGSIQGVINTSHVADLNIPFIEGVNYDEISTTIAGLDAKIELNNKINAELEAMAKLIYDYWFVQFDFPDEKGKPYKSSGGKMVYNEELQREIPEGWDVKTLKQLIEIGKDQVNPSDSPSKMFKHLSIPIFDSTGTYQLEEGKQIGSNKFILEENDLAVSKLNPWFNRVFYPEGESDLICTTEMVVWKCEVVERKNFFYQLARSEHFISFCTQSATGTSNSHKRVNPTVMTQYKLAYENDLVKKYGNTVTPWIRRINLNKKENQKLAELRDWLLPMLMNGQVKVK